MSTGGRGSRYKLTGPGGSEEGPGPDCVIHVIVLIGSNIIFLLYLLTLLDQAQFSLQQSLSFLFSVKISSLSAIAGNYQCNIGKFA